MKDGAWLTRSRIQWALLLPAVVTSVVVVIVNWAQTRWRSALAMPLAICLVVLAGFSVIALAVAYTRRLIPPLAQSAFPMIALAVLANTIAVSLEAMKLSGIVSSSIHCGYIDRWAVNVVSMATVLPYMIRGWRLHVIFSSGEQHPRWADWFYMISDAGLIRMCAAFLSVPAIFTVIQTGIPWTRDQTSLFYPSCTQHHSPAMFALFFAGNSIVLIVYFLVWVSIHHCFGEFGIQNELRFIFATQPMFVAVYVVALVFPGSWDPSRLVTIVRASLTFLASVIIPVQQTFCLAPVPVVPCPERALSLSGILSDPFYFAFFSGFVSTDPDCALLEFFVQAKLFPDEADRKARRDLASRIFDAYLRIDSPHSLSNEIDLESSEIAQIRDLIASNDSRPLPDDLFASPAGDVFHQMEHFTLRRFRQSQSYEAMLQEMHRHLLIRERMFYSDMIDDAGVRLKFPLVVGNRLQQQDSLRKPLLSQSISLTSP